MPAKRIICRVTEVTWLTPSVVTIRFEPNKRLKYEAGQFLSIYSRDLDHNLKPKRRAYSFASPPERAKEDGYELCIKLVAGGAGSDYMASLRPGDTFEATAPYGDFVYQTSPERHACFVCTGTGIAPIRAMVLSREFQANPPVHATCLFGARSEEDLLYTESLRAAGVEMIPALTHPGSSWLGFRGRVTDYLNNLPSDWAWHETDFYLCGNGEMINEVRRILISGHGVPSRAIFQEAYFAGGGVVIPLKKKAA